MYAHNVYRTNPPGKMQPLALPAQPPKKLPPAETLREAQNNELRAQGGKNEVTYSGFAQANPSIPLMPSPIVSAMLPSVADTSIYFDSLFATNSTQLSNGKLIYTPSYWGVDMSIDKVTKITISPFFFPRMTWREPVKSSSPDYFYLRRVYLFITQIPTTAGFSGSGNKHYHWEFEVRNIDGISVELVPLFPSIYFETPSTGFDQLDFQFLIGPNLTPINLWKSTMTVTYLAPSQYAFLDPNDWESISTEFNFPTVGGVLTTPVAIWVTATTGVATPAIINDSGWFITELNPAFGPYGGFTVASFVLLAPVGYTTMTFDIRKNRIAPQMRFSKLQAPAKNSLVNVHL